MELYVTATYAIAYLLFKAGLKDDSSSLSRVGSMYTWLPFRLLHSVLCILMHSDFVFHASLHILWSLNSSWIGKQLNHVIFGNLPPDLEKGQKRCSVIATNVLNSRSLEQITAVMDEHCAPRIGLCGWIWLGIGDCLHWIWLGIENCLEIIKERSAHGSYSFRVHLPMRPDGFGDIEAGPAFLDPE